MTSFSFNHLKQPFSSPERRKVSLLACLIFVAIGITFAPALQNNFIATFDDADYVTANYHVQQGLTWQNVVWAFTNTATANWHPLTWLSHMLDCDLFGLQPWGHHLVNVLLHAGNAVLLLLLLWRLTGAIWRSFFVAALFGLHPAHVESVAWASERKDVLSVFFGLLSLLAYTNARMPTARSLQVEGEIPAGRFQHRTSGFWFLISVLCFACSLMSKPMLVTLPFILLLLDWLIRRSEIEDRRWGKMILEKWPFFLLSAAASAVTFYAQKTGGAMGASADLSLADRMGNAVVSYARYLGELFWPVKLSIFYPHPGHWPLSFVALTTLLLLAVSIAVVVMSRQRYLLVGWCWFLGTLVPVIGLVQVGAQSMADRYTYLPSVGIFIMVAWGGWEWLKARRHNISIAATVLSITILSCVPLTWRQIHVWADGETLFRHALAVTEDNEIGRLQLGLALDAKGDFDGGIREFEKAIALNPHDPRVYNNLGVALEKKGRGEEAIEQYRQAVRLNPQYADAYVNLGTALDRSGQSAEGIAHLEKAMQLKPAWPDARYNLGNAYVRAKRFSDGIAQYQEAIRLNPRDADAHANLGVAFSMVNRLDDAIIECRTALNLRPGDVAIHNNLGTMFYRKGMWDDAIAEYQAALKLEPGNAEAQKNLAMALRKKEKLRPTDAAP